MAVPVTVAPHEIRQRILKPFQICTFVADSFVAPHEIRQRILKLAGFAIQGAFGAVLHHTRFVREY